MSLKTSWKTFLCFILSWTLVAFGQPAWSPVLSLFASVAGYALFWVIFKEIVSKKKRFIYSCAWFMCVQAIQLSWMSATAYHGIYILCVYVGVIVWFGIQFGLLSLLFPENSDITIFRCCVIASSWVLMEWSRLFFFCGFPFNFCGVTLAAFAISSQLASVIGTLGLSFVVMLLNMFGVRALLRPSKSRWYMYFGGVGCVYVFGILHWSYHHWMHGLYKEHYRVALIQTGLKPEEKVPLEGKEESFVSPFQQWYDILSYLKKQKVEKLDLIVLPEAAIPFGVTKAVYPVEDVERILRHMWGINYKEFLPTLGSFYVKEGIASNAFWAQAIANYYQAEFVVGLDDYDKVLASSYNAAFHFIPNKEILQRYEKCILVPLGEYLPLIWLKSLVAKYGVFDFATPGLGAKIFGEKVNVAISICYEECFGHFMRQGKEKGAQLFVNVTNDGWYLPSKLPKQHFYHARLRSVENGVPLLRACNTGVTAAIDSLNNIQAIFSLNELAKGALIVDVPLYHYRTLYTLYGDLLIIGCCFSVFAVFFLQEVKLVQKLMFIRKLTLVKKK